MNYNIVVNSFRKIYDSMSDKGFEIQECFHAIDEVICEWKELKDEQDAKMRRIAKEIQNHIVDNLYDDCNFCIAKDVCENSLDDIGCDGHIYEWMKGLQDE